MLGHSHTARRSHEHHSGMLQYIVLCSGATSFNYAEHVSAELGQWATR